MPEGRPTEVEPVTNGYRYGPVTKDVTCVCGAVYSVTCKRPPSGVEMGSVAVLNDWTPQTAPTDMWEVLYKSNNAVVPFDEWSDMTKIKFNCQAQGCNGVMECNRESFKIQVPDFPMP